MRDLMFSFSIQTVGQVSARKLVSERSVALLKV